MKRFGLLATVVLFLPIGLYTQSGDKPATFALAGDTLITQKLSVHSEPEFLRLIEVIRGADVAFANLEMLFHDYEPYPAAESGGTYMRAEPFILKEIPWAGFDMVSLANRLDGLGITFDVGHSFLNKRLNKISSPEKKIAEEIRLIGDHLAHVHLHDNRGIWDEHLIPGKGDINFRQIVKALREIGYDGRIIAELHNPMTNKPMEIGKIGLTKVRELFKD